jgi:hypothetical protein
LLTAAELAVSISEKAECVACGLEAQFQQVNDPSESAVNEMFKEAAKEHDFTPTSEPQLKNALTVQEAIRDFEVGKSPWPNAMLNRVLKHPPERKITFIR